MRPTGGSMPRRDSSTILGADSLAVVELTLVFEETFDIDIPDEEADRIRTVQDAIISVERNLRAQGRP